MRKLEILTYICVVTACLLTVGLRIEQRFRPAPPSEHKAAQSLKGHRLELSGVDWSASDLTAVLFVNSHCRFCQESKPFYGKMSAVRRNQPRRVRLFVASIEPVATTRRFVDDARLEADGFYQLPAGSGLSATPTVLILDRNGVVQRVMVGKLSEANQAQVIDMLDRGVL